MIQTVTYPVLTEEEFSSVLPDRARLHTRKPLSSVILSEEIIGEVPTESTIRYVEVPVVEEIVKTVPVKSVVEIEKIVPRYEVEYIEKVVEVPEILYIDRPVEKEHIQEVIHEVPGETEIREIPQTYIHKIPKIEYIEMEKIVEVPGRVIDISKEQVDELYPIKEYSDVEVPVVVAQTIRPIITKSNEYVDVDVFEYEPQITPVDVYVATPITSKLVAVGAEEDVHNCVSIPPAQYNTILKSLNPHIDDKSSDLPFIKTNGVVGFLAPCEAPGYVPLDSREQLAKSPPSKVKFTDDMDQHDASNNNFGKPNAYNEEKKVSHTGYKKPPFTDKKKRICGC